MNALYLIPGGVGGTEIYLRGLLAALAEIDGANEYLVFTNRETGPDLTPAAANFRWMPQAVRAALRPARILWEQTALPLAAARLHLDVMLNPGFTAPLGCPCPQVTVFHDLQHKRHPEYFRWFDLPFWEFFLFWSAQVSTMVLADSEATAADLRRFYRLPDSKIRTVPLGVDPVFFDIGRPLAGRHTASGGPASSHDSGARSCSVTEEPLAGRHTASGGPFLLAVSTLHPHKNLDGLLRAFAVFRQRHPDFRLVVCGIHGFFTGPLEELRQSLGLADVVEFPGWIPRQDLHELYRRACAFVYPSLFEGFGLPVVEALAAGVPTACSNIEPVAGIAADAALQFDPLSTSAMAEAMARLVNDDALRLRLAEAGPRRAAEFSWRATAEKTLAAIQEARRDGV